MKKSENKNSEKILKQLKINHEKGKCNCDLTEGGYGLCLYGQYENKIITKKDLLNEIL